MANPTSAYEFDPDMGARAVGPSPRTSGQPVQPGMAEYADNAAKRVKGALDTAQRSDLGRDVAQLGHDLASGARQAGERATGAINGERAEKIVSTRGN
jgi:hypothetical protein